jgi:hypothetical protein
MDGTAKRESRRTDAHEVHAAVPTGSAGCAFPLEMKTWRVDLTHGGVNH